MSILFWLLFIVLLFIYGKFLLPTLENLLGAIFVTNLAENISLFIVFCLSVVTLAKFINGEFQLFFMKLFKNHSTDDVNRHSNNNDKNISNNSITFEKEVHNYENIGYKQAKAEEELNEAQEIIDNYKNNQKD
jgi:hypothetical protein